MILDVFEKLVGQTIKTIVFVGPEKNKGAVDNVCFDEYHCIVFINTDNKQFVFRCYGDCCNTVWFDEIVGFNNLCTYEYGKGKYEFKQYPILSVSTEDWVTWYGPERGSYIHCEESIDVKFTTEKGNCYLKIRNSHNGYYSGDVDVQEQSVDFDKFHICKIGMELK